MKPFLLDVLQCDACGGELFFQDEDPQLVCTVCGKTIPMENSIPLFSPPPTQMVPSEKMARGPGLGTPWRQANWHFLQEQVNRLGEGALILDVGAGRGDFAEALTRHRAIALEVYPYPEVDVVCDLTQTNPFRPASFEAILLLNVLEHVYDTHALLDRLAGLLKPDGILLVAIPFMVKMHQVPVDFVRYTHFALARFAEQHGLLVEHLEGYYDPVFFLGEGIGNLKNSILPGLSVSQKQRSRVLIKGLQFIADQLQHTLGPGKVNDPAKARSLAPTGYQVVYRKHPNNTK